MVVPFNHARHPHGLYSAVETCMTFFSFPSFIATFLPPSLAKPGTGAAGVGGGRLNVYDAIRSNVVHAATFRAAPPGAALPLGPPASRPLTSSPSLLVVPGGFVLGVCGLPPVNEILSSSYWPIQWTTTPTSTPASHESAGPS